MAPALPGSPRPLGAGTWHLRWSPSAARDGLAAFEGVEDDRAGSHPAGVPHIGVRGDAYRFSMHLVDRDRRGDRQRQEVKGMRLPDGRHLVLGRGEVWRLAYRMRIPRSLGATRSFTHIFQVMPPGTGTLPLVVMSLRRRGGAELVELKAGRVLVGAAGLAPLRDRWVDVDLAMLVAEAGWLRWRLDGGRVVDAGADGVGTWLPDRVRPKWGIYRALGDDALRDCHLDIRDLRAYQWAPQG
ncbi:Tat pathway signal sequence domain protein [Actinokineospora sp. NPDC004072]